MTDTKKLEVLSIHYDYVPGLLEGPKMVWVNLRWPPRELLPGMRVRIHARPGALLGNNSNEGFFIIDDIVGTRVTLVPATIGNSDRSVGNPAKRFDPRTHSSDGWGYNMKQLAVRPGIHDQFYGYGVPVSFLEFGY